ncbi:anti-sigma factor [Kribbella deserti]|uniref:Regulator of SigK n=1 Tax=Kribbella deserti TaxID=1926257 RepID=A0ABV6QMZ8_9ACTN
MTTPDVHTLTGPYVLNALPEDERIGFERHLADCQSCSAEVTGLREAAVRLGQPVAEVPPAELKARVMAQIAATRQLPPQIRPEAPVSAGPDPVAHAEPRRWTRRSFFSLAASAAAVVGVGGVALDQYRDNQNTQRENQRLAALLAQPDAKTVRGNVSGGGQATVVMSARQDTAIVLLHGLRKLPDDRTYQLWLMDKAQDAYPVGLASPAVADQTHVIEGGLAGKVMFGLTVEAKGGATKPHLPAAALIPMA